MTATDELRRLLDERGVEYRVSATGYSIDIGPYTSVYANRSDTTLDVSLRSVTPEQAIEAVLGRRTCHKLPASGEKTCIVRHNSTHLTMEFGYWRCSECGCECFEGARYCMSCGARVVE